MKILKWIGLVLLLAGLTGCGEDKPPIYTGVVREPAAPVEQQQSQPETDYTIILDGELLEIGGVGFGEDVCIPWQQAKQLLGVTQTATLKIGLGGEDYVMLGELCGENGFEAMTDAVTKQIFITTKPPEPWDIPAGYRVPVLMYHGVSDNTWGGSDLFIKPAEMEAQICYLLENGYTPIWFEDLVRVDEIEKPVILSYDDGYMDNYTDLFPILKKYGVKATVFVVTGTVGNNPKILTEDQIREMSDSGLVSIQSHTVTHPYLKDLPEEEQEYEFVQSRRAITAMTGKVPEVICYPSGSYDAKTIEIAKKYFCMGVDMNGNLYTTGNDPYQVQRFYIRRQDSVGTVASYIR